jgi:hypothetical protein
MESGNFLAFLMFSFDGLFQELCSPREILSWEQTYPALFEMARRIRTPVRIIKTEAEIRVRLGAEDIADINRMGSQPYPYIGPSSLRFSENPPGFNYSIKYHSSHSSLLALVEPWWLEKNNRALA